MHCYGSLMHINPYVSYYTKLQVSSTDSCCAENNVRFSQVEKGKVK